MHKSTTNYYFFYITISILLTCFLKGTIARKPGSGRPSKITPQIKAIVDEKMVEDNETTAYQLYSLLNEKGYTISMRTVLPL